MASKGSPISEKSGLSFVPFLVILLSITPFIYDLTLFNLTTNKQIPAEYIVDPSRFEGLLYLDNKQSTLTLGKAPTVKLPKQVKGLIKTLFKTSPESYCLLTQSKRPVFGLMFTSFNRLLSPACAKYQKERQIYQRKKKRYDAANAKNKRVTRQLEDQADQFLKSQPEKSPAPPPQVMLYAESYLSAVFAKISVDNPTSSLLLPAWTIGLLLLVPSLIYCVRWKHWGLLFFGLAVPTYNYILDVYSWATADDTVAFYQLTSPIFAQIALLFFVLTSKLRSKAFVWFIVISLFSAVLPLIQTQQLQTSTYSVFESISTLVIFTLVIAFGRFLKLAIMLNREQFSALGFVGIGKASIRALLLWLPMGVLCLPFFYVTQSLIPTEISRQLNKQGVLAYDETHSLGLLDNTLQSSALKADDINFVFHLVVEQRKAYLYTKNKKLQNTSFTSSVDKYFEEIIPAVLAFEQSRSNAPVVGFIVDLANDEIKQSITKTFANFRQQMKSALLNSVMQHEKMVKQKAKTNASLAIDELEKMRVTGLEAVQNVSSELQAKLFMFFNTLYSYQLLAFLLFSYVCLRSYLYVFARVCFHHQTGVQAQFVEGPSIRARIENCGNHYIFKHSTASEFYVSRRFQCRGKAPKLTFVQSFSLPLVRLLNNAFTMNKISLTDSDIDVSCSSTQGSMFIEWQLQEDEHVVFDMKYFVGMSGSVVLSTLISPKLSSLLLGKLFYAQATGPGTLILMAKGQAQISTKESPGGSLPPDRMVALSTTSTMKIDSELDLLNTYFSSVHVTLLEGNMVVDVDTQSRSTTGLSAFIKHFLIPG